jgi:hypothetical protein
MLERDMAVSKVHKLAHDLKQSQELVRRLKSNLELSTALVEISYAERKKVPADEHENESSKEPHNRRRPLRAWRRKGHHEGTEHDDHTIPEEEEEKCPELPRFETKDEIISEFVEEEYMKAIEKSVQGVKRSRRRQDFDKVRLDV